MPVPVILGQLTLGLVNGSFYALLSLGLAVIFGLMGVVNFAHGAFYTLGAFAALLGLQYLGINYWVALLAAPLAVGLLGVLVERLLLRHLYGLDPLYGLLLTFGLALIVEGSLHQVFGASGQSYPVPESLVAATYGGGVALAALAGVLASPVVLVNSHMGTELVIVVFAVVVIGGMGSILGAIVSGLVLGLVEGFTKVIYPEASNIVVFVIMALVLILRPAGLFGRE